MLWHYDKDLSGYTSGQGGYYSPQEYVSFALPVTGVSARKTGHRSWGLGLGLTPKPKTSCATRFRI